MKVLQTRYGGCHFRSRLEARWAVFFDKIGVRWEHEPEGFELSNGELYLPDFRFPEYDAWGEVKPEGGDFKKLERLCFDSNKPGVKLEGQPHLGPYDLIEPDSRGIYTDCFFWTGKEEGRFYVSTGFDRRSITGYDAELFTPGVGRAVIAALCERFESRRLPRKLEEMAKTAAALRLPPRRIFKRRR